MSFEEHGRRHPGGRARGRWRERPADDGGGRTRARRGLQRSLAISTQTLAGIGLGLLGVLVGAAIAGAALETVIVPGLLVQLVGGAAGGGIGMAKGLHRGRTPRQRPRLGRRE